MYIILKSINNLSAETNKKTDIEIDEQYISCSEEKD